MSGIAGRPRHESLWWHLAGNEEDPPCPPLRGARRADVAIIGGGYVGLWTAIELARRTPSVEVALLESGRCGSGASSRNAGFALSWWPKAPMLATLFGHDSARAMLAASEHAIAELGTFCREQSIHAGLRNSGWVWGATSAIQRGCWTGAVDMCRKLGVGDLQELGRHEAQAQTGSAAFVGAVLDRTAALVQPAALVRGLRRVALELGVTIFEDSRVVRYSRGRRVTLSVRDGSVMADTLIIATNAWAASIPELRRAMVVVSSDIAVTPPVPDRLHESGWNAGPGVNDSQQMVNYMRTTDDGRVLAGKGGAAVGFGGRVAPRLWHSERRTAQVRSMLHRYHPNLAGIPIEAAWSGPVDRSADGLPLLGRLPGHPNILYGVGWSGNGIAPSLIGGRVLAGLALEADDAWTRWPLVGAPRAKLPPEPLRFVGAQVVKSAVRAHDRAEAEGRRPRSVVRAVARLAPRGIEDR